MSAGYIILLVLILLVMFGAGQRVLDRMRMSDTWALVVMIAIAIGLAIPTIRIGNNFEFNIGGFLIPFGVCIYLLVCVGKSWDLLRAIVGTLVTAGLILGLEYLLPASPEGFLLDYMFIYGIVAGLVAYLLGRSRRNALICSVFGITLARVIQFVINICTGVKSSVLSLGSAGAFDSMVIAVLFAVALCELLGEGLERLKKHNKTEDKYAFENGRFVDKKSKKTTDAHVSKKEKEIKA